MIPLRTLIASALVVSVIGCAALPEIEGRRDATASQRTVTLSGPVTASVRGAFGKNADVSLLPGTYRLERGNDLGQFFVGTAPAVWWTINDDVVVARGGVWLPKAADTSPRIYFYATPQLRGKSAKEAVSPGTTPAYDIAASLAAQATPLSATPMQAGIAGGVAGALVGALSAVEIDQIPQLYPPPSNRDFDTAIRAAFGTQ